MSVMSVPDPITLLQFIFLLIDYSNQLAGAGKEMTDYCKTIKKTSDLVKEIRIKLAKFGHLLDDSDMDKFLRELQEADDELKSAGILAAQIEKRRSQWSKNVTWVLKNKPTAQLYCTAIAHSHSALREINMQLFFLKVLLPKVRGDDTPPPYQRIASSDRRSRDDISHLSIRRKMNTFPISRSSSLSRLRPSPTHRNPKTPEPDLEIDKWLLKQAQM